jgi:hypothetical protein
MILSREMGSFFSISSRMVLITPGSMVFFAGAFSDVFGFGAPAFAFDGVLPVSLPKSQTGCKGWPPTLPHGGNPAAAAS